MLCLTPLTFWSVLLLLFGRNSTAVFVHDIDAGRATVTDIVRPPSLESHDGISIVTAAEDSVTSDMNSATSTSDTTHEHLRHLVWDEASGFCSDEVYQQALARHPTLFYCSQGSLQWDPDGLLTAVSVSTAHIQTFIDGTQLRVPVYAYSASYNGPNGGGVCNSFDYCRVLSPDDGPRETLYDQYTYDCSNVYCGAHAKRSCDGVYEDAACPVGTNPPRRIPSYAEVLCEIENIKSLAANENLDHISCTTGCTAIGEGVYGYPCALEGTAGCYGERCVEFLIYCVYGEKSRGQIECTTFTDTQESFCFTSISEFLVKDNNSNLLRPRATQCAAEWNGVECECTVCGLDEMYTVKRRADCSDAARVASIYNACDGTFTGIFSVFAEEFVTTDESEGLMPPPITPATPTMTSPVLPPTIDSAGGEGSSTSPPVTPTDSPQSAAPLTTTGIPPTADSPNADGIPPTGDQEPKDPTLGALGVSKGTKLMLPTSTSIGFSVLLGKLLVLIV